SSFHERQAIDGRVQLTLKDSFRSDLSNESAQLVGEVKTLIKNAKDNYSSATRCVYEWCELTTQLLQIYIDLFDERISKTYEAQRELLVKVLDDGYTKMSAGQSELEQCASNFNKAAGRLATLNTTLAKDFDTNSSYFQGQVDKTRKNIGAIIPYSIYARIFGVKLIPELQAKMKEVKGFFEKLQGTIEQTYVDIDSTKGKLKLTLKSIGVLKVRTEETEQLI
ncbi:Hemolysin E, chromosomal, partial [Pseudolycoriella hygida]